MLGVSSNRELDTCHPKLQRVMREVDRRLARRHVFDFKVVCGHRGQKEQEEAVAAKRSTKHWPDSKHNQLPSVAVDLAPYPTEYSDEPAFARLAGYVLAVADDMGIELRWGGDWNANGRTSDERLVDLPHFELSDLELGRP